MFFWFGIVGVVLTVALGICLGLCIKENWDEIKLIDRAIEVFDLDKIKNFKEPKTKRILVLDLNKNKNTTMSNSSEINTNKQNDNPKLRPIDPKEIIDN